METGGLGCNLEEGMETHNSCEDCQNVQEASLSNVSKHKLTDDKHTIDSNGEQIANMWKIIRKPSYVSKLLNSKENGDNKLFHVPTVINESGQEFVIFDDELVKEGSKKWEMLPLLVIVKKWDPSINLDRTEPTRLPVWIKLINIPLEAWTHKGLNALASRVGKPLIMDAMTTKMCNEGMGSLRYARILIEANASKGLVDFVEVLYLNKKEKEIKKNQDISEAPDGFVNVKNRKSNNSGMENTNNGIGRNMQQNNQKKPFQRKEVVNKFVYRQKQVQEMNVEHMKKVNEQQDKLNTPPGSKRKVWNVGEKEQYDKNKEVENEDTVIELDENYVYVVKEGIAKFMTENEVRDECSQSMLYHVEVLSSQKTFFCIFIYAANRGKDRRELWKDLSLYKRIVGDSAWAIMGDVNVSLNLEDHSEGISYFTHDMLEFQECINDIEMEDINWSGMHFTWTKSLNNPNATVLKKLDRVMGNLSFLTQFSLANAIFLPYGISDHSPAILTIPQVMKKKNKSFRMANYITDKMEFKDLVKEKWNMEVQGHAMFKMVKKLKALKPYLNKLNWKHGNLFDRVSDLKKTRKLQVMKKNC
ncbi:RNA-directed DNA polymerase, eukaryota, reverse transcriptase zinc-binding domain protein [Tanacetum coccineum]